MTMKFSGYPGGIRELREDWLTTEELAAELEGRDAFTDEEPFTDFEDGDAFTAKAHKHHARLSQKAMAARNVAKMFGGKALKGTARQKEWAEKIRAAKITCMSEKNAIMACDPTGLMVSAKFWIENRDKDARAIGEFVEKQKALLAACRAAKKERNAEELARIAPIYNALTAQWGF